eukprot:3290882-Pleurochrysis_carterae.AAC.1
MTAQLAGTYHILSEYAESRSSGDHDLPLASWSPHARLSEFFALPSHFPLRVPLHLRMHAGNARTKTTSINIAF